MLASTAAMAQSHGKVYLGYGNYYRDGGRGNQPEIRRIVRKPKLINWLPEEETPRRFAIGIRPFQLLYSGLRADFEFELGTTGQWLQVGLSGYGKKDHSSWNWRFDSGYSSFISMGGVGLGAAYKDMLSNGGWYWTAGLDFNFYDIKYMEFGYYAFYEDGLEFFERDNRPVSTQYYRLGLNLNIGKHFALGRNLFLDLYVGLGYHRSFKGGYNNGGYRHGFEDGMYSFGHNGFYFSNGLRLAWMWQSKK